MIHNSLEYHEHHIFFLYFLLFTDSELPEKMHIIHYCLDVYMQYYF